MGLGVRWVQRMAVKWPPSQNSRSPIEFDSSRISNLQFALRDLFPLLILNRFFPRHVAQRKNAIEPDIVLDVNFVGPCPAWVLDGKRGANI